MKKYIICSFLFGVFSVSLFAQKKPTFSGKITYSVTFENSGLPKEAIDMMKNAQMVTYINEEHRRVDLNMPMQSTSSFFDLKTNSIVTLMDIAGQKYLIRTSKEELQNENDNTPAPVINYLNETKEIAGYKCNKAEVSLKSADGKVNTFIVYYTSEIPASDIKSPVKGLKGFPLSYSLIQGGINMTFSAISVSKETISDSKFEIPKNGYTETTLDGLQIEMSKMTGK